MPQGSCMCGEYQHEYSGNPIATYKKTAGKVFNWTRKGDSGKNVTYNNCATCGCIMTVSAEAMPEMVIFKAGTLDDQDAIESSKPAMQIYNKHKPAWCDGLAYAQQKDGA
ncbi:hypothetical protein LTR35_010207 [Friedmanniomyces endolithicus]|uniref:CENP-V/GFA domain-containing protein n=1 Tax=Friedmanniomyces endolithicus TaxID=329885 RepID=A0AAN6FA92_9PEZI|nr:hypothetical protein LTR35_010207 [Friedmanniomyces endolithicus]KAK0282692.1 hypothetical protein LTS00_011994 [Friedmanniomyces endolithicus]KAK0311581.1 hypothetical protein LTR82_014283 [Friedmanniomyces endolithicus]KAK0987512.1 hypothetical protein LTR54_013104 [Friedmanniomyces endolithicus]KAK1065788.1 hypothetical protein LTR74_007669 [Friedmanniomyces endolithicus]